MLEACKQCQLHKQSSRNYFSALGELFSCRALSTLRENWTLRNTNSISVPLMFSPSSYFNRGSKQPTLHIARFINSNLEGVVFILFIFHAVIYLEHKKPFFLFFDGQSVLWAIHRHILLIETCLVRFSW